MLCFVGPEGCRPALPSTDDPGRQSRWPLKRLDHAFKGFFRRVRSGGRPGFPRFRSLLRWRSFGFSDRSGWKLVGRRLKLSRIGVFRLHLHRGLEGEVRSLIVKHQGRKWFAFVTVKVADAPGRAGPAVGLDLGVTRLATLSSGEIIANHHEGNRRSRAIAAVRRTLARAARGSKRRQRLKRKLRARDGP